MYGCTEYNKENVTTEEMKIAQPHAKHKYVAYTLKIFMSKFVSVLEKYTILFCVVEDGTRLRASLSYYKNKKKIEK